MQYSIEVNIGETYYRMKMADSAALYFKNSLVLAKYSGDSSAIGASILGEANVLTLKNEPQNALQYYRDAYSYLYNGSDVDILCEVTLGMARAYEKSNHNDSAADFGNRSYFLAEKSKFLSRQLDAALFLSGIYNRSKQYDSAFFFLQQSVQLKDSVKGHEKIKEAMILSLDEKLRQEEIAEQKIRDKQARFEQLQLLVIAICIPALFLVTLLISRIKIHRKLITFMGILSLLFLFEFLTLLLHPAVAVFTHHIPILELLIFVGVGILLVPAHHRLESILINKLTKGKEGHYGIPIKTKKVTIKKQE